MRNTLPLALKTPIWKDFCDAWDEELILFKEEILKKKDIYITDEIKDEILKNFCICVKCGARIASWSKLRAIKKWNTRFKTKKVKYE
jgi:hypothetical protein